MNNTIRCTNKYVMSVLREEKEKETEKNIIENLN